MDIALDEVIHFDAIVSNPSTGAAVDADSTPTWSIFEEDTDTAILSAQNFTKRTSLTGNYRGSATLSAGNGFEVGKWYNVVATGVVGGVTGKAVVMRFRAVLAEAVAGAPKVDLHAMRGVAQSAIDLTDFADTGYDPSAHKVQGVVTTDTATALGAAYDAAKTAADATDLAALITTIGVAGAGLTALGDTRLANLDATVSGVNDTINDLIPFRLLMNHVADGAGVVYAVNNEGNPIVGGATAQQVWEYATRTLTAFEFEVSVDTSGIATDVAAEVVAQLSGVTITLLSSLLPSGLMTIRKGDDYSVALDQVFEWSDSAWPSLAAATVVFTGAGIVKTLTKPTNTSVRLTLTHAETLALTTGTTRYSVVSTYSGGEIKTLAAGNCDVTNQDGSKD